MTFHDNEMTSQEIHGTLLRMATDELGGGTEKIAFDSIACVIQAEDLLADVVAARIRQQITQE